MISLVFHTVSETSVLRSLITKYQDHARELVEAFRRTYSMIEDLAAGKPLDISRKLKEVESLQERSLEIKRTVMKELSETGTLLVNREDLFRLISKLGEIIDFIHGLSVMISEMAEMKWRVPDGLREGIVRISEATFETIVKLRESLIALGMNSPRSLILAKEVEDLERKVDVIHREMDLRVITCGAELPIVLLLRDIIQFHEDISDRCEQTADLIRILVL